MILQRTIWFILLSIIWMKTGLSQSYLVHHYTELDGLASSEVHSVEQASSGRLWFATRAGISVYDGFKWKNFQYPADISFHSIRFLESDTSGTIWAAGLELSNNIHYYRNGKWHELAIPERIRGGKNYVEDLAVLESGSGMMLAIAASHSGLLLYNESQWTIHNRTNSPLSGKIKKIEVGNNGFYVLCENDIFLITPNSVKSVFPQKFGIEDTVKSFAVASAASNKTSLKSDRLWLLLENQMIIRDVDANAVVWKGPINNDQKLLETVRIFEPDGYGGVFLGNWRTVAHYDTSSNRTTTLGIDNGLITNGASDILIDHEANIWIASYRGVNKIPLPKFISLNEDTGLLKDEVTSVVQRRRGELIFGHIGGLTIYKHNKFRHLAFKELKSVAGIDRVLDMSVDDNNDVWIAAYNRGLGKLTATDQIHWYNIPRFRKIVSVKSYYGRQLLVATQHALFLFDGNNITRLNDDKIKLRNIRKIFVGGDSTIYLTSLKGGLYRYRDQKWSQIKASKSLYANRTVAVLDHYDGDILVGTEDGLYFLKEDSLKRFNSLEELKRPIYFLLEDRSGHLWMGTDAGVFRLQGNRLEQFTVHQGLAGNETNRDAAIQDSAGVLWFGTNMGASFYRQCWEIKKPPPPKIQLTTIETVKNTYQPQPLNLPYHENNIIFKFNCISFYNERHIKLRYKLEGLHKTWLYENRLARPSLRFLGLEPGEYRLSLQAQNLHGNWSPVITSSLVTIRKPIWRRAWFLVLAVFSLGIFIYLSIRFVLKRNYTHMLEEKVKEHTHLLRLSEVRYRNLIETARDAVFVTTPRGKFLEINPAGVEIFGYESKQELLNTFIPRDIYVNPDDRNFFKKELHEKGFIQNFEVNLKRKDGSTLKAILSATAEYDKHNEIVAYRGFLKDVTELWHLREQLAQAQKMESIGMLAGGVAHDFNNILGGILGYASLMKFKLKPEDPNFKYLETIEKTAKRGAELTSQLLVFSRKDHDEAKVFNPNDVVLDTLKIIKSTFPRLIELEVDLDKKMCNVEVDHVLVQRELDF